jgi:hypothetical protein
MRVPSTTTQLPRVSFILKCTQVGHQKTCTFFQYFKTTNKKQINRTNISVFDVSETTWICFKVDPSLMWRKTFDFCSLRVRIQPLKKKKSVKKNWNENLFVWSCALYNNTFSNFVCSEFINTKIWGSCREWRRTALCLLHTPKIENNYIFQKQLKQQKESWV